MDLTVQLIDRPIEITLEGMGTVDYSEIQNRPTLGTASEHDVAYFVTAAEKAQANGVATLGSDGKILSSQLPLLAVTDTFVVASQAAMLALTAQRGDVAKRTDTQDVYILSTDDATQLANWVLLSSDFQAAVDSINGRTGIVTGLAEDNTVLHITGNESAAGVKTFTSAPIVNLAGSGTTFKTQIAGSDRIVLSSSGGDDVLTASGGGSNFTINAASIRFQKGGTEYGRLHSNGNFGIGTTTPTAKLEVVGGAKVDQLTISGTPSVSTDAVAKAYVDAINSALSAALTQKTTLTLGVSAGADFVYTSNDFHTQLQNAVNALPAVGGKIYIKDGAYVATARANINKAFVEIELAPGAIITVSGSISTGGGRQDYQGLFHVTKPYVWVHGGTVDLNNQLASNVFSVWGSGSDPSVYTTYHVKFSEMIWKNKGGSNGTGADVFGYMYGGTVNGSSVGRVKDVLFQGIVHDTSAESVVSYIGDYFKDIIWDDCEFKNVQKHVIAQQNYLSNTSDRIIVRNSLFEHTKLDTTHVGSLCDFHDASRTGGRDLYLINNKFTNKGDALHTDGMAINIHEWQRFWITDNSFSDMNQALSLGASDAGSGWDQQGTLLGFITGNTFDNLTNGVDNDATYHLMWHGNHFRNMAFRAIGWYANHHYQTITDNHFYDCNDRVEDDAWLAVSGMVRADIPEYDYAIIENGGNDRTIIKDNFMIDDRKLSDPGASGVTVGSVAGGALAARTYSVRLTYANSSGETLATDAYTGAIAANNLAKITFGTPTGYANNYSTVGGIRKINIYAAINGSPETLQGSVDYPTQDLTWTEPTTGLISGAALPTTNTTHALTRYGSYILAGYIGEGLNEFEGNHVYGIDTLVGTAPGADIGIVGENYHNGRRVLGTHYTYGSNYSVSLQPPTDLAGSIAAGGSLVVGKRYNYIVVSLNGLGESTRSNEITVAPTTGNQTANLTWTATPGATQYKVFRSLQRGAYGTSSLVTTVSTNSATDMGSATTTGQPLRTSTGFINRIAANGDSYIGGGNLGLGVFAPSSRLDVNGAMTVRGMAAPSASASGQGRIYFDSTSNTFKISENAGSYVDLFQGVKGANNGIAPLDSSGLVPSAYLPSFVDDVLEAANFAALPATGATGKIYVTLDNNKTYRWSGSAYVEISASPGSTDSVTEGSTNLYYTEARVAASAAIAGCQPIDSDLTAIAAIAPSNDDIIQRKAGAWTNRTIAQLKTDLVLVKGDVGLGNVDNTSDATKNAASASLTNKTIVSAIMQGEKTIALSDGGTINTDASLGNTFTVTIAGNRTIANPTNATDGQKIIYRIKQDATGARTITWGSEFRFSTDLPVPVLSGTPALTDYVMFKRNGTDSKWDCLAINRGF